MASSTAKKAAAAGPVPLADSVYRQITDAVVDQRLQPGMRLNELALCGVFKISRREMERVLMRLTFEGIVSTVPNRGAFVASPDAQEARLIFAARRTVEAGIVELAAVRASGADFKALERSVADEEAHRHAGRMRDAIKLSGHFHIVLADVAANPILGNLVRQLVARTSLVTSLYENAGQMGCWHDDHSKLIAHLRARRTRRAVDVMRAHLDDLEESLDLGRQPSHGVDLRAIFQVAER